MALHTTAAAAAQLDPLEHETIRRVAWRLIPVLMLGYFCAYLDRVNVGFAKLTMQHALNFSEAVFGFGAGVFFIGYFLAEIPSNLVLNRVGARKWIARILLTWGIVSALTAFVWNDWSFYGVRFLLGLAEAGFYPGIVLYLTWWFPSYYRSRMMGIFQSASVISLIVGPPVSAYLLTIDGWLGLQGWQWLFLIEALPPIIMAVVTWVLLTDRPMDAQWLRPEQRSWLQQRLDAEQSQRESVHRFELGETMSNPRVWLLTAVYFGQNVSGYGLLFFLPTIVKSFGVSTIMNGVVSAIPFVFAAVAMIYWSLRSDRSGARTMYVASACLLSGVALMACVFIGPEHPVWMMIVLILGIMGQSHDRTDLLAAADGHVVGCRGGGRHRSHQRGRQPGRLSWAVHVRTDQGCDRWQRSDRADGNRRRTGDLRHHSGRPGTRQPARAHSVQGRSGGIAPAPSRKGRGRKLSAFGIAGVRGKPTRWPHPPAR